MDVLYSDNVEAIRQYLSTPDGIQTINNEYKYKFTPLYHACYENRNDVVDVLIEFGVDVNLRNTLSTSKCTPLHSGCHRGHIDIVQRLLNAGADPNIVDRNKTTPIMYAASQGHLDIVKLLTIYTDFNYMDTIGFTIFTSTCFSYEKEMIDYVFDFCTNINHTDTWGKSYLHWAVKYYNRYAVKLLLAKGIDINIQDDEKKKASDYTDDAEILLMFSQNSC